MKDVGRCASSLHRQTNKTLPTARERQAFKILYKTISVSLRSFWRSPTRLVGAPPRAVQVSVLRCSWSLRARILGQRETVHSIITSLKKTMLSVFYIIHHQICKSETGYKSTPVFVVIERFHLLYFYNLEIGPSVSYQ